MSKSVETVRDRQDPMLDYQSRHRIEAHGFCFEETVHHRAFEMNAHVHAQDHFAFVLSGQVENRTELGTSLLGANAFSYMASQTRHKTQYRTPVRAFYVSILPEAMGRVGVAPAPKALDFFGGPEHVLGTQLVEEYRRNDPATPLILEGLVIQLYGTMARAAFPSEVRTPEWLRRAQEILHADISRKVLISDLAEILGVHPVHLMRSFQRQFGLSIGAYTRKLRIEIACQRLGVRNEGESLGQLAQDLGYPDQSQFNRAFRSATGMTPTQYRNRKRNAS